MVVEIGPRFPLHSGASSRAILAWLPRNFASEAVSELRQLRGDFDEPAFLEELDATRRRGYAISHNERGTGGASIAAAFFDLAGNVVGLDQRLRAGLPLPRRPRGRACGAGRRGGRAGDRGTAGHHVTPRWPELVLPRSLPLRPRKQGRPGDQGRAIGSRRGRARPRGLGAERRQGAGARRGQALARRRVRRPAALGAHRRGGRGGRPGRAGGQPPRRDPAGRVPGRRAGASRVVVGAGGACRRAASWGWSRTPPALREIAAMAQAPRLDDVRHRRGRPARRPAGDPSGRPAAIDALRRQVVVDAAAAGLPAPVAPTSTDFRDLDAFRATTGRCSTSASARAPRSTRPRSPVINEVLDARGGRVAEARGRARPLRGRRAGGHHRRRRTADRRSRSCARRGRRCARGPPRLTRRLSGARRSAPDRRT